jgi:hypothetical protein
MKERNRLNASNFLYRRYMYDVLYSYTGGTDLKMNENVGDDCFPCGIGPFSEVGLPGRMQACIFHKSFTDVEVTFL